MIGFIIFVLVGASATLLLIKNKNVESKTFSNLKESVGNAYNKICYFLRVKSKPVPVPKSKITDCPDMLVMDVFDIQKTESGESYLVTKYSEKIVLKENEVCCICREGERTDEDGDIKLIYLNRDNTPQWDNVSRRHLYVSKLPTGYAFQDNHSTYSTFVYKDGIKTPLPKGEGMMIKNKMILLLAAQYIGFRILHPDEINNIKYPTEPDETSIGNVSNMVLHYPDQDNKTMPAKKMFYISFK